MSTDIIIENESVGININPEIINVNVSGIQTVLVNVSNAPGIQGPQGDRGIDGLAASVAVGTVLTVQPNIPASVVNVGTPTHAILNFEIPKGDSSSAAFLSTVVTDYDYDINGSRNGNNKVFVLTNNYVSGTTKVYVNGLRQTPGENYDYEETGQKTITFKYNIDLGDLLIVEYIKG